MRVIENGSGRLLSRPARAKTFYRRNLPLVILRSNGDPILVILVSTPAGKRVVGFKTPWATDATDRWGQLASLSRIAMNPLHLAALNLRTNVTLPLRSARMRGLADQSQAPISVLFYHRIATTHPNGWTLTPDAFLQQLDYCQQNAELIDLAEVQRRVREQDSRVPAVSITFDDGYADNIDFAIPYLLEHSIACTYFVTTSNIRNHTPFPHDRLAGQPLAVNTVTQIREMSQAGIEIGCHTRHHVDFSRVFDHAEVRREICDAKDELEQLIGKPVRYFAFPFGLPQQLTQMAIEMVAAAGFDGFCSAFGAYNLVGRDAFHIRRIHGDPEFCRFKNWLSFDPRKINAEPSVRYFLPPHRSFAATVAANALPTE